MNDKQTKSLNEFRDIQGMLGNYETEISQYGILQTKVGLFNDQVKDIATTAKRTAINTTGVTKSKGKVKKQMATLAAELAASGFTYASDQNDLQLEGVFSIHYSEVYYAKDEDSLNMVKMLHGELNKIPEEERDDYLIFKEDMEKLDLLTKEFESLSKVQGGRQADSIAAHRKLNVLFKNTSQLLRNSLDRLMLRLKRNVRIETESTAI